MSSHNTYPVSQPEVYQPVGEVELVHHATRELPALPLYGRDEAMAKWGINGDIRAVLQMPDTKQRSGKRFFLVDYGNFSPADPPSLQYRLDGSRLLSETATSRYYLKGVSGRSDSLLADAPIAEPEMHIGRDPKLASTYYLGLGPNEPDNETTSRNQATITIDQAGRIFLTDHSKNGTGLERRPVTKGEQPVAIARPLGALVLSEPALQQQERASRIGSKVDSAMALIEQAKDGDMMLGQISGLDVLMSMMTADEQRELQRRQIEWAAIRPPKLADIINQSPKNYAGVHEVPEDLLEDFKRYMVAYGARAEAPSETELHEGIRRAKELVRSGQAEAQLYKAEFLGENDAKNLARGAKAILVSFKEGEMYIDPALIKGAGDFGSWAGRGHWGRGHKSYKEHNGRLVTGPSIGAIEDYATRPTALPVLESLALEMILTNQGPVFYAYFGGHRIAAAKLRGEPLQFSSIEIRDAR